MIGGEHPGLGIARSLGRRGIPVAVIDDQLSISRFSRYVQHSVKVPNLLDPVKAVESVLETGKRLDLRGWVLFPTRDETVAAFSTYRSELERFFRVTTPNWDTIKWAWDKSNTYDLAEQLGIPSPTTFRVADPRDLKQLYSQLPLAIKPAIKENFFYSTGAKAWRANTPQELERLYRKAALSIDPREILIQQIIPGDGTQQISYCAFFHDGEVHSSLVAMRGRQHPPEFGRAATYVETIECEEVEELSVKFLQAINYYGLVELEFKRDCRDGKYKLLDVNARTWGFHSLGLAAGVDFPYLLFANEVGQVVERSRSKPGVGWLRLVTDVPTAVSDLIHSRLSIREYFGTLRRTRIESVFSHEDPRPFIAEILLLPYLISRKYL